MAGLLWASSVQAGLLLQVTERLGLQPVVTGLSEATGLALDDLVLGLDGALSPSAEGFAMAPAAPANLGMSPQQQFDLRAMDAPAMLSTSEAATLSAAVDEPLAGAGDQPALRTPQPLQVRFASSYAQAGAQRCIDSDADGICDRDDQCRGTPRGQRVMTNGCHLDAASPLRLSGVQFADNQWQLDTAARNTLQQALRVLRDLGPGIVEIAGHTDARGAASYNLALSEKRAAAVRRYFIDAGIPAQRLRARGYGETQPLSRGDGAANDAENRRVELRLLPQ